MKQKLFSLTLLISLLCFTTSCIAGVNGIEPSKNYITRDYKVTEFDKIDVSTVANIHYKQSTDNSTSVRVYGPDNIVDLIEVSIKDRCLIVKMKKNNITSVKGMRFDISTPTLSDLNQRGVGNVYIEEGVESSSLSLSSNGVGNIKAYHIRCQDISIKSAGVGNIEVSGEAINAFISSDGVGNLKAENLEVKNLQVISDGIGNVSCYATESISATNKGIGNIRYKGNPKDKNINKSGIGSIKQI